MGTERKTDNQLRDEFRLKEYEALLDKIAHTRGDVGRAETIYPLATATIYAWTFANPPTIPILWAAAMMLPVAIAVLAIVKLYSRQQGMSLLEQYIREIEAEIYGEDSKLGWERRYAEARPLRWFIYVRAGLAIAILGATLWMACNADAHFREMQLSQARHG